MFKNLTFVNKKTVTEINIDQLKKLALFESIDGKFNELGFSVSYLRIPNGVIRTVVNNTSLHQIFIPL